MRCVDKSFALNAVLPVYVVCIRDDVLRLISEDGIRIIGNSKNWSIVFCFHDSGVAVIAMTFVVLFAAMRRS